MTKFQNLDKEIKNHYKDINDIIFHLDNKDYQKHLRQDTVKSKGNDHHPEILLKILYCNDVSATFN